MAKGFAEYGVPRGDQAVKDAVQTYADAGVDDLIFDPTLADPRQIDLLADPVF